MDYVAQSVEGAELKEFEAGHMMNLKWPTGFKNRLGIYFDKLLR